MLKSRVTIKAGHSFNAHLKWYPRLGRMLTKCSNLITNRTDIAHTYVCEYRPLTGSKSSNHVKYLYDFICM